MKIIQCIVNLANAEFPVLVWYHCLLYFLLNFLFAVFFRKFTSQIYILFLCKKYPEREVGPPFCNFIDQKTGVVWSKNAIFSSVSLFIPFYSIFISFWPLFNPI